MTEWTQLQCVLEAAADLPEEERAAFVAGSGLSEDGRLEVLELLQAMGREVTLVDRPAVQLAPTELVEGGLELAAEDPPITSGSTIGQYLLERALGGGGMGVVWRAQQLEPIRRPVALKMMRVDLVRADASARLRFQAEQQALALMTHRNIARVLDAGASPDGEPFFVMELAEGEPITHWCDRHRLGIDQRLELFLQVCDAIQHAHRKGVLHRDLKPDNVLVTGEADREGRHEESAEVKVIDFGIATPLDDAVDLTGAHTQAGLLVGTPGYMSPEQIDPQLDAADVRTDVYALGVLLQLLLVGQTPHQPTHPIGEFLGRRCNEPPLGLGEALRSAEVEKRAELAAARSCSVDDLLRKVGGELESIVLRALATNRELRYGSVGELGDDVRRFLAGELVHAHPATLSYRTHKLLRRSWREVALASALLGALISVTVVSQVQSRRTGAALEEAQQENRRAEAVTRFLTELFESADPSLRGADLSVRQLVEIGGRRLESELADAPDLRASMAGTLGVIQRNLGDYQAALQLFEQALADLKNPEQKQSDLQVARARAEVGETLGWLGRFDEARPRLEESLAALGGAEADSRAVAETLLALGRVQYLTGEFEAALASFQRSVEIFGARDEQPSRDQLQARANVGALLTFLRREAEARPVLEQVLEIARERFPNDVKVGFAARVNLVSVLDAEGDHQAAVDLAEEMVEVALAEYGEEHPRTALALHQWSNHLLRVDLVDEALETARRAEAIYLALYGAGHPEAISVAGNLPRIQFLRGEFASCLEEAERVEGLLAAMPEATRNAPAVASTAVNLRQSRAYCLTELGRLAEGEALLRNLLGEIRHDVPVAQRNVTDALFLGNNLAAQERFEEAEPFLLRSWEASRGQGHELEKVRSLRRLYERWGRPERQREFSRLAVELARDAGPGAGP